MRILFITNDVGGFADHVEVADGPAVARQFADRLPGRKAADFLIRVNRLPAAADHPKADGNPREQCPNAPASPAP